MTDLKKRLYQIVNQMGKKFIKYIVADHGHKNLFMLHFKV